MSLIFTKYVLKKVIPRDRDFCMKCCYDNDEAKFRGDDCEHWTVLRTEEGMTVFMKESCPYLLEHLLTTGKAIEVKEYDVKLTGPTWPKANSRSHPMKKKKKK